MSTCPYCGRQNLLATGLNTPEPPSEGAVNLCWRCREPSLFQADLSLRKATDDERADIMADPDVKQALYVMTESTRPSEAEKMFERISSEGSE